MKYFVEPNNRGGWSIRQENESPEDAVGNYPTPADAARIARHNFGDVEIVEPKPMASGIPALPRQSAEQRLAELTILSVKTSA
jgi:hypothetical protein